MRPGAQQCLVRTGCPPGCRCPRVGRQRGCRDQRDRGRARPDVRAAAGGRHGRDCRMCAGRWARSGHGGRPLSGGSARGRGRTGGKVGRSRGNVGGELRARAPRRRRADVRRIGFGRGKRQAGAAEDISPLLGESPGDLRRERTLRAQPDRAGRGGRDPRRSRDGPAGGLRQCNRDDAPRPWRRDSGRLPQDTHDLARVAPGACVPRRAVPVPRVSESPLRFAPRSALGRRRRDGARQSRAVVPPPPPVGARGGVQRDARCQRGRGFVRPDGRPLAAAPQAPAWTGVPLAPTNERLDREDNAIGPNTATPAWRGERLDVAWAVGVLWRPRVDEATVAGAAPS